MVTTFIKSFIDGVNARSEYYNTLNELKNLTDRDLKDIGLSRTDIYQVAAGIATNPGKTRSVTLSAKGE